MHRFYGVSVQPKLSVANGTVYIYFYKKIRTRYRFHIHTEFKEYRFFIPTLEKLNFFSFGENVKMLSCLNCEQNFKRKCLYVLRLSEALLGMSEDKKTRRQSKILQKLAADAAEASNRKAIQDAKDREFSEQLHQIEVT